MLRRSFYPRNNLHLFTITENITNVHYSVWNLLLWTVNSELCEEKFLHMGWQLCHLTYLALDDRWLMLSVTKRVYLYTVDKCVCELSSVRGRGMSCLWPTSSFFSTTVCSLHLNVLENPFSIYVCMCNKIPSSIGFHALVSHVETYSSLSSLTNCSFDSTNVHCQLYMRRCRNSGCEQDYVYCVWCVYLLLFLDSEAQYMIILFMVFIVQFSVSSACLAINREQQVRRKSSLSPLNVNTVESSQLGLSREQIRHFSHLNTFSLSAGGVSRETLL